MSRRRYQRIAGLPLGIEGYRPASSLRDLICDLERLMRWIATKR